MTFCCFRFQAGLNITNEIGIESFTGGHRVRGFFFQFTRREPWPVATMGGSQNKSDPYKIHKEFRNLQNLWFLVVFRLVDFESTPV